MKLFGTMWLGLVALGLAAAPVTAKDYEIKLDRPAKVGERHRTWIRLTKKESMTLSKDGNVLMQKDKTETTTMQGVVEVQKVDNVGEVLKVQLVVEKFVNAKGVELLKKGQVVIAETIEKKTAYRLTDGMLTDDVKKRLAGLLKTKSEESISDDKAFGTKGRKKVGDSWKIDSSFAGKSIKIAPKNISGSVKLEAVEKFESHECLRISVKMKLTELPGFDQLAKQGLEKKSLDSAMHMVSLFPTDQKTTSLKSKMSMSVDAEFLGVKGALKGLSMKLVIRSVGEKRQTVLK